VATSDLALGDYGFVWHSSVSLAEQFFFSFSSASSFISEVKAVLIKHLIK
jgi:hypothetical protein